MSSKNLLEGVSKGVASGPPLPSRERIEVRVILLTLLSPAFSRKGRRDFENTLLPICPHLGTSIVPTVDTLTESDGCDKGLQQGVLILTGYAVMLVNDSMQSEQLRPWGQIGPHIISMVI